MALAVALAWFTKPNVASPYPSPALPPAAQAVSAPDAVTAHATPPAVRQRTTAAPVAHGGYMDAGQKVAVDPATGQTRPIEHDDLVQVPSSARRAVADPVPSIAADGTMTFDVPNTTDVYTVATKAPNGSISVAHASGLKAAKQKMRGSLNDR
jgi:hypothetical protein